MMRKLLFLLLLPGLAYGFHLDEVESLIEQARADFGVTGLSVLIVAGGAAEARGYGYRDLENQLPVTGETLFAIGSCTKAFTAFAIAKLVEDGLLTFDRPVIATLPEFQLMDPYATRHVTVRDLLAHRTGLSRHDLVWYGGGLDSAASLLCALPYLPLAAELRERFLYNNMMYAVAGELIERLRGHCWEREIERLILDPLEMHATNFSVDVSQKESNYALPYKGGVRTDFHKFKVIGAAGAMNSSAEEMASWVQLHLGGGAFAGMCLLSESLVREMHTPQIAIAEYPERPNVLGLGYCLGWNALSYRGHFALAHGGNIDGFAAQVLLVPHEGVGMVILANEDLSPLPKLLAFSLVDRLLRLDSESWLEEGLESYYAQVEAYKEAPGLPASKNALRPFSDYVGLYEHPGYGQLSVEVADDALLLRLGSVEIVLAHLQGDLFVAADPWARERTGTFAFCLENGGELVAGLDGESESILFSRGLPTERDSL